MAIVNVTPDSFSGDGVESAPHAIAHAIAQWRAGADFLDIGGESTRPGHRVVDESVEIARVIPVIRAFRAAFPVAPISIDSFKPAVVRAAHAAGADIVNSVWGMPPALLEAVAELEMPIVAMHNQNGTEYGGPIVDAVLAYLDDCASRAVARGIAADRVILDPGVGFGKTAEQNIAVLEALPRLVGLGFPTLIGTSRKSTLGKLVGREPNDRVYATVATTAFAIAAGVDVVRVHDVRAARSRGNRRADARLAAGRMDRVTLRGVRAYGRHGWEAAERDRPQPFAIDLDAEIDLRAAQTSDDLSETIDYAELHRRLVAIVASTSYALLERLASDILEAVFEDRRVVRAIVTIAKPAILDGATPSVTFDRANPRYEGG